jgi:hypothetical protein
MSKYEVDQLVTFEMSSDEGYRLGHIKEKHRFFERYTYTVRDLNGCEYLMNEKSISLRRTGRTTKMIEASIQCLFNNKSTENFEIWIIAHNQRYASDLRKKFIDRIPWVTITEHTKDYIRIENAVVRFISKDVSSPYFHSNIINKDSRIYFDHFVQEEYPDECLRIEGYFKSRKRDISPTSDQYNELNTTLNIINGIISSNALNHKVSRTHHEVRERLEDIVVNIAGVHKFIKERNK